MRARARAPPAEVAAVPEPHRVFVEVLWAAGRGGGSQLPAGRPAAPPSAVLCLDATRATFGSMLDAAAKRLGVANPNATTADPAKRLHLLEDGGNGGPLAPGERLSALIARGALASGGRLLLVLGSPPAAG